MGIRLDEEQVVSDHLEPLEIAAFIDRTLDGVDTGRVELHLAGCDECRSDMHAAIQTVAALPAARRERARRGIPVVAAAAAVLLLILLPWRSVPEPERHREPAVTSTAASQTIAPRDAVDGPVVITWTSVPQADGYLARVFDAEGSVLWERETTDTTLALATPPSCVERRCYWKVEARTGFGRSAASELREFWIRAPRRP